MVVNLNFLRGVQELETLSGLPSNSLVTLNFLAVLITALEDFVWDTVRKRGAPNNVSLYVRRTEMNTRGAR
jgi:hypothetical protein